MKNILVPCDFSTSSINAYRLALDIAILSDVKVHVLHVIEFPVMPNTVLTPVRALGSQLMKEMTIKAKAHFTKLTKRHNNGKVNQDFNVEFGVPSKVILNYAKKHDSDLIVIGSHGTPKVRDYFLGYNTLKIVRSSPVPVLVVKNIYKGVIKNIVVPFAPELESQPELFEKVKKFQSLFKAHLHLVWINTPLNFTRDEATVESMTSLAKKFKLKDYTINIYNHSYEEVGILDFTESIGADMIAMGTHGRKGLAHLIYGSKTEIVLNYGKYPIWTYAMK